MRALCNSFTNVDYISSGSSVEEHLANFIGKTHTVQINGQDHVFMIVGINHDTIATGETYAGKKALFT